MTDSSSDQHVVLFPYMSKGHIIPLLQFARLFLHHQRLKEPTISVTITVFTTPKNQAFVNDFLPDTPEIKVISLPFPQNIPGIPTGVESTDTLPSISLYVPFTRATKLLQPFFEESLKNLPQVSFMVSDAFLWWTSESSAKFNIPRLVFYGMNNYSTAISISISNSPFRHKLSTEIQSESETEPVFVPDFPWIQVTWNDFYHGTHTDPKESGPALELSNDQYMATETSHGFLVNSFYELESTFADYNNNISDRPKSWCVGPLCLTDPPKPDGPKPAWIDWLDQKREEGNSVLYVAFGTQAEISNEQLKELALGLEDSKVNFLWVTRRDVEEIIEGFKDRTRERGMIVRDWVNQWEILSHESVKSFLSHCGWNSAQESICIGVPLLAWPMMAEQPLNAKLIVEEIKVGLRVETQDGSLQGFVTREELSRKVKELMEGETGKILRKNVKKYSNLAKAALDHESGSSWKTLDLLISKLCKSRPEPNNMSDS